MPKQKFYRPIFINNIKTNYGISKDGEIISLNYKNSKTVSVLKPQTDKDGYKYIHIHVDGKVHNCRISRLVALTYIPIPKRYINKGYTADDLEVNHKDGIKSNNHISNLEWCTPRENILHAERNNLRVHKMGENHPMAKYTEHDIRKVCVLFVKNEYSIKQISDLTGVDIHTVFSIFERKLWKSVSKDYDFSNYNVKSDRRTNCPLRKYEIDKIHEICKLLEDGELTMNEISNKTGVSNGLIQKIKYRSIYQDISKGYNFKIRKFKNK